jgi:taurine dioxygenase
MNRVSARWTGSGYRCLDIPAEGGRTGFADGIDLYQKMSKSLREQIETKNIVYRLNVMLGELRFGRPKQLIEVSPRGLASKVMADAKGKPRAIHPAVWTRSSGEKVLHVSPWMAEGIEGMENTEGDALLEAVCQEINMLSKTHSYFHQWRLTDMVIWDNWRVLHAVSGTPPQYGRRTQRTTIKGDYGLGHFEHDGKGDKVLEMEF